MVPINIVIPMAGRGSRFTNSGYLKAKPFIEVDGRMMIEHVLEGLPLENNKVLLIILKDFQERYKDALKHLQNCYNVDFSTVVNVTAGAACTALSVRKKVNPYLPVLFVDADSIFIKSQIQQFIEDANRRHLDGSLLTFISENECFSYIKLDQSGKGILLREKEVISSHAVAGAYYFFRYLDFEDYCTEMLIYGDCTKNEYYMSNVYNYMIEARKHIGIYEIGSSDFQCVGTPNQLDHYLKLIRK